MGQFSCLPLWVATHPGRVREPHNVAEHVDAQMELICRARGGAILSNAHDVLRIITWNVWFDPQACMSRWQELLVQALSHDPHVICFQEVTPSLLKIISASVWVQQRFDMSMDILSQSYDVFMLVQHGLNPNWWSIDLPSRMGRRCLVVDFTLHGIATRVATTHLESCHDNADWRARQLEIIFSEVDVNVDAALHLGSVILCGDFNFCSSWKEENTNIEKSDYADAWPKVHADDPGYTEDTMRNKMLYSKPNQQDKRVRFDRILVNSPKGRTNTTYCNAQQIELLGTVGITDSIWASDHFGLYAEIGF